MTYKKHYTDENGSYEIIMYYDDGRTQVVSETQDLYQDWLAEGNTPEEVPYVPPTVEEKRLQVENMIVSKQYTGYSSGFEYNGETYPSTTGDRELINTDGRIAQRTINEGSTRSFRTRNAAGDAVTLTEQEAVERLEACDEHVEAVYDLYVQEMTQLETATEEELDYYIEHGEFE